MTITTISSATKEVKIGFDQPFVIIGERINPTGRKILAEEMKVGDYSRVEADALAQVAAGANKSATLLLFLAFSIICCFFSPSSFSSLLFGISTAPLDFF